MSRTNDHNSLDDAIARANAESIDPQQVEQAAARVWQRLSALSSQMSEQVSGDSIPQSAGEPGAASSAGAPSAAAPFAAAAHPGGLHGCADFQALIPAYLRRELSPARALLLEDHTRSCVPCRRALREAREARETPETSETIAPIEKTGARQGAAITTDAAHRADQPALRRRPLALALAAVLLATLGVGIYLLAGERFAAGARIARLESIDGSLLRIAGASSVPVAAGDALLAGEEIRTAKGSRAVVRMNDGTKIEMSERAGMALRAGRRGNTIALARGRIIVQAAPQRPRHLYVDAGDCLVSVTGTVFAVNHGIKGTRVSVVEGEVRVEQARRDSILHPGDQVSTRANLSAVPVRQEIAWSRDATRYEHVLAMLARAGNEIDRQVERPGLRTSTHLLDLAPATTSIYIALPNLTGSLAETQRLLERHLAQNEELRQWWSGSFGSTQDEARYQTLMQEIGDVGHYLGEEIAVAIPLGALTEGESGAEPVLLAEVASEASFRATLQQEADKVNARAGRQLLVLVDDPAGAPAAGARDRVLLWVGHGLFAAARSAAELAEVAGHAAGGANPFVATAFHARIADSYADGAGWLFANDLARLVARHHQVPAQQAKTLEALGIYDLEHLIVNYREEGAAGETRAALTFGRSRRGIASWLAAPAPMGSLDFFSAGANLAASFVVKSPVALLDELLSVSPEFAAELTKAEAKYHFDLRNDLAVPLGGEVVLGLDGPLLPTPSWKLVAEVYDPARLQDTFSRAAAQLDHSLRAEGKPGLTLSQEQVGGRTFYALVSTQPAIEIHYVFAAGFLVAAPSRALIEQALELRASGATLAASSKFRGLLGHDGQVNASALFYRNLDSLSALAGALPAMAGAMARRGAVGAAQNAEPAETAAKPRGPASLGAMMAGSGPGLVYAYAEDRRILFGGKQQAGRLGMNLQTLAGFRALLSGIGQAHGEAAREVATHERQEASN